MNGRVVQRLFALALLALVASPTRADGMSDLYRKLGLRPAGPYFIEGARWELGSVNPDRADAAVVVGVNISCGTLLWSKLDWTLGGRWWSSSIKAREFHGYKGDVKDFSIHSDLNWHFLRMLDLRLYLMAGPAFHFVSTDVPQNSHLEDAIGGFHVGLDHGLGLATARKGVNLRGEIRREEFEELHNWNFTLGVGWWPSSDATILPKIPAAPTGTVAPVPTAASPAGDAPQGTAPNADVQSLETAVVELKATIASLQTQLGAATAMASDNGVAGGAAGTTVAGAGVTIAAGSTEPQIARSQQRAATFQRFAEMSGQPTAVSRSGDRVSFFSESFLTFPSGSDLDTSAREATRRLAALLLMYPEATAIIEGHADSRGSKAANQKVSQARAESVRQELLRLGVSAAQIEARGVSESRPVADNGTPAGRMANRRASISVKGEGR